MAETELMTVDPQTGEIVAVPAGVGLVQAPDRALADAIATAKALQEVIEHSAVPVVRFNGKVYLEFHHWQTIAAPFGVTTRVVAVDPITIADVRGFHASAVAVNREGRELSRAESFCMSDEATWKSKPLFQLASMAQTRAQAKVLRNILSHVAVLAGYSPTPAEEMTGDEQRSGRPAPRPAPNTTARTPRPSGLITEPQQKRLFAIAKQHGWTVDQLRAFLAREGFAGTAEIPIERYEGLCAGLPAGPPSADDDEAPF